MRNYALYRHFSSEGKLLYIGVTSNLKKRTLVHKSMSRWFNDIARIDAVYFDDYLMAVGAESRAIKDEAPIYNKDHNKRDINGLPYKKTRQGQHPGHCGNLANKTAYKNLTGDQIEAIKKDYRPTHIISRESKLSRPCIDWLRGDVIWSP